MNLETVYSVNDVPIRLTEERWEHIVENHPYMTGYYDAMLDALEEPDYIIRGHRGALTAVVALARNAYLHIAYREIDASDGFIISAYVKRKFDKKKAVWRKDDH